MESIIKEFIKKNNEPYQRYNSWCHCYDAFGKLTNSNNLALHLGFYLASWGMYRGSSNLLQKDYLVHIDAVKIIKSFDYLSCFNGKDVIRDNLADILELINQLSEYYKNEHDISPTDTLISKIVLGTLGCLPAFDRLFIDGVKSEKQSFKTLKSKSLNRLFDFVENTKELEILKHKYNQYPVMKLVDMYFWQIGYNLALKT
ncbi:hypothetical protein [Seonamhaeicola sp.]|uniref:hypothetical protein n=1 Tax=Seonamhaeicola sp. TaxID=1912245 RepID=UPI0026214BD7|nr:hypothetical protein [Seonamhaeicola sp.]